MSVYDACTQEIRPDPKLLLARAPRIASMERSMRVLESPSRDSCRDHELQDFDLRESFGMESSTQAPDTTVKPPRRRWIWVRRIMLTMLVLIALTAGTIGYGWWYYHPNMQRRDGIVYGDRGGRPLTMDVLIPNRPNGKAIAFMVSGGWKSKNPGEAPAWMMAPLLQHGYTIFAVCHISQPDATIMEIIEDMHRSIRFIRHHAAEYQIDPTQIGVTGGSAGGHLSLMLATRGQLGDPEANDPVDRERSDVQAVAIFYPVTDLLDLKGSTEDPGDGGPPKSFVKAFGPGAQDMPTWKSIGRDCSPIYHIHDQMPPILIYHGDADTLVPLSQSERFCDEATRRGKIAKLVVHPGGEHGWLSMFLDIESFASWFDRHLEKLSFAEFRQRMATSLNERTMVAEKSFRRTDAAFN